MSITQNPLIGRARKSFSNVRFSTWNGLNIVASKPLQVKQNVTDKVLLNRNKMSVVGSLLRGYSFIAQIFIFMAAKGKSKFSLLIQFFRNNILDTLKISFTAIAGFKLSNGNFLINTAEFNYFTGNNLSLSLSFIDSLTLNGKQIKASVFIFNEDLTKCIFSQAVATVSGNSVEVIFDIVTNFSDNEKVQCLINFTYNDNLLSIVSDTVTADDFVIYHLT